jgi:molecular chaperone GrpE
MSENTNSNRNTGADAEDRQTTPAPDASANGGGRGPGEALPPATAEERAAALAAERDELKDRMLRIAAEFENWKKRASKAESDAEAKARESVLRDMLEVIDGLERATSQHSQSTGNGIVDGAAVLKGVNLVLRVFQQKLERHGVRPFESQGQPFDPRVHEAISRVESTDVPPGSVAAELQKGYRVGERLLRPALVSVSAGPRGSGSSSSEQGSPSAGGEREGA